MVRLIHAAIFAASLSVSVMNGLQAASEIPVAISVRASTQGAMLQIHGNATVPDGAWIIYAAYSNSEPQTRITGYARVEKGQFAAQTNISSWPPGKIKVDAHFQVPLPERKQPDAVVVRFGRNGERMTGKSVVEGGGAFRAAIASTTVIKP
jgi:hypothetical protein